MAEGLLKTVKIILCFSLVALVLFALRYYLAKDLKNTVEKKVSTSFNSDMKETEAQIQEAQRKAAEKELREKEAAKKQQAEQEKYVKSKGSLNVRSGPSKNFEKVGLLQKGDVVKLVSTSESPWIAVEYSPGNVGYVYEDYIEYL